MMAATIINYIAPGFIIAISYSVSKRIINRVLGALPTDLVFPFLRVWATPPVDVFWHTMYISAAPIVAAP